VRGTVPREVLDAGRDLGGLQPGDGRRALLGDPGRVGAERAGADGRIVVGGVHVQARRQVESEAGRGEVGADGPVDALGQLGVVDRPECGVARVRAAGRVCQAGDVAALLVGGEQDLRPGRPQRPGECAQLVRVRDVVSEDDVSRDALTRQPQCPTRHGMSGERRQ
jgi:hypothetical protein